MTRFRLDIAYDGAAFHGWAAQNELRTIQGELELWIGRVMRLDPAPSLTVAGRTDAGVHARGQVAHVDLPDDPDPDAVAAELRRRLSRVLPPEVAIRDVGVAPEGFDARFAAIWRRYAFRLGDHVIDPLLRHMVVQVRRPLDVDAMDAAASALIGLHDFAAFCKRREGATTVRQVLECSARRIERGQLAGVVEVGIRADAFCHSMVRSVVGALVAVGTGQRDAAWLAGLIDSGQRAGDVAVLPPHGLVLEEVGYPADDHLAARQNQARARRDAAPTADDNQARGHP